MADISNDDLRAEMEELIKGCNLEEVTTKQFMKLLSKKLKIKDLSSKKKFIKATLTEIIDAMGNAEEEEEEEEEEPEEEEESEEEESEEEVKPKRKPAKRKKSTGDTKNNPFNAAKNLSPSLASFLGTPAMSRPQVVKALWDYIKANDLQDPSNKKNILLDDRMQSVFGVPTFTMFKMAKYISAHIEPFKPVVESDDEDEETKEKKKRKREEAKEKRKSKKGKGGEGKKRTNNMPPHRLSEELALVVGKEVCSRPKVTKKLWEYIRKHSLQNPNNGKEIICDENLKAVMGGNDRVGMFAMAKYLSPHFLEKVDRSEYVDSDAEIDEDSE